MLATEGVSSVRFSGHSSISQTLSSIECWNAGDHTPEQPCSDNSKQSNGWMRVFIGFDFPDHFITTPMDLVVPGNTSRTSTQAFVLRANSFDDEVGLHLAAPVTILTSAFLRSQRGHPCPNLQEMIVFELAQSLLE